MSFRGLSRPNATSGMGVSDHGKNTYMELQRKKAHRYVIFKIEKEVLVEKTGRPAESYDDFTLSLPENDCRYAVYDLEFLTSDNCQKSKIFSLPGLLQPRKYEPRCCMPHLRIGLDGSWKASTLRFRLLTLRKWILK